MASIDTHVCIFCERKMATRSSGEAWCNCCCVGKQYRKYHFTRQYKNKLFYFAYYLQTPSEFIIEELGRNEIIYRSDDFFQITPQNWEKKLPMILVFS